MTKRGNKFRQRKKERKRIKGFELTSFVFPAQPPASFDMDFKEPVNDELGYFKNFAMMMPTKAIRMPSKKEMKKLWYSKKGRRMRFFPTSMYKPWQRNKFSWSGKTSMIEEMKPWIDRCSGAFRKMQSMMDGPQERFLNPEFSPYAGNPITITITKENHSK